MTARRRAAVNGVQQVQLFDDARRGQVIRLAHSGRQAIILAGATCAKRIHIHHDRLFFSDGVGQRDLTALGKACRDDVFGNKARHICAAAVYLGGILAAERTAAVGRKCAVAVHHELAPGQAGIGIRTALHKLTAGVQDDFRIIGGHTIKGQREHIFVQQIRQLIDVGILFVLNRHHYRGDAHGGITVVFHRDLHLAIRADVGDNAGHAGDFQQRYKALGGNHRHRQVFGRFVAGVADHNALIARAEGVIVLSLSQFGFHRARNVGALVVDVAVDLVVFRVIADIPQGVADDVEHVGLGRGRDFARHNNVTVGCHDLTGHAAGGIILQTGVQHAVGNNVAQLVGMPAHDGFCGVKTGMLVFFHGFGVCKNVVH